MRGSRLELEITAFYLQYQTTLEFLSIPIIIRRVLPLYYHARGGGGYSPTTVVIQSQKAIFIGCKNLSRDSPWWCRPTSNGIKGRCTTVMLKGFGAGIVRGLSLSSHLSFRGTTANPWPHIITLVTKLIVASRAHI